VRFSQKTEYALRALVELGRQAQPCGHLSCRAIATSQRIPERFCEQVLASLRRAGLIESQRGASGGVKLVREPAKIPVSEVVDIIEGPVVTKGSIDPFDDDSRALAHSSIQELWLDLQITVRDRLASVTIADLIARQDELDRSSRLVFQI
jgi:Rrf2 family protein